MLNKISSISFTGCGNQPSLSLVPIVFLSIFELNSMPLLSKRVNNAQPVAKRRVSKPLANLRRKRRKTTTG